MFVPQRATAEFIETMGEQDIILTIVHVDGTSLSEAWGSLCAIPATLITLPPAPTGVHAVSLRFSRKRTEERALKIQQSCVHSTLVTLGTFHQWPQMTKDERLLSKA